MPIKKNPTQSKGAQDSDKSKVASESQLEVFDRAVKLFRAQQFQEARSVFELATQGNMSAVAHNARLHINMCDRRLQKPALDLRTLDDHYHYAVERMNARDLDGARRHLETAIELSRQDGNAADHIYYALAACQAIGGDLRAAYENLKRAIEIEPKNRVAARHDPDFTGSAQQATLLPLLYPEKSSPF